MLALVVLCILMFLGCYAAGYIPLAFTYSPHNLRLVTIVGAGLLVGAALAIIIPEGVATIYGIQHNHGEESLVKHVDSNSIDSRHLNQLNGPIAAALPAEGGPLQPAALRPEPDHTPKESSERNHGIIGLALTLGFVIMFLVDHLGTTACCLACTKPLFPIFSCCRRSNEMLLPTTGDDVASTASAASTSAEHSAMTTTVGLVVHSLADGLAIGAAFGLTLDLTLILFVAIMLHKAPAAFGFVSFLVHEGLPRHAVRKYLLAFALASPVGALLTYFSILISSSLSSQQSLAIGAASPSTTYTGFALLLSGGTFLYVATAHILPHLNTEKAPTSSSSLSGSSSSGVHRHHSEASFKPVESLAFVLGACIPVAISFGHSH
ncbi:hypothetical protein Aperf_G00000010335 [Anoplocephala perfoliata]